MFASDFRKCNSATIYIVFSRVMTLCASENQAWIGTQKSMQLQDLSDLIILDLIARIDFGKPFLGRKLLSDILKIPTSKRYHACGGKYKW